MQSTILHISGHKEAGPEEITVAIINFVGEKNLGEELFMLNFPH